ncbi:MAG: hypothetical protein IPM45_11585 [Acidimicrobiales bacterium]|nr:hypothetical protein [Acidimicrobiales bacterium]
MTRELVRAGDGGLVELTSRRARKRLPSRPPGASGPTRGAWHGRGVVWAPGRLGWWIGVLFMVGSACFAVASLPGVSSVAPAGVVGTTYFVGSVFFTSAAYLQYVESVNTPARTSGGRRRVRLLAWQPQRIDWWASAVQLVGTLWFNVSTFEAMASGLGARQQDLRVWTPDLLGSVCFLVSSWLAVGEVCHRWWRWSGRDTPWWIANLNLIGSVWFMASALAAFVAPDTGDLLDAALANSGTLLGAVCFFWAARLLLVELADAPVEAAAGRHARSRSPER